MSESRRKEASNFAHFIRGLGFRVFLAKSGEYGFITDKSEERVLSFGFSSGSSLSGSLSGNYGPSSTSSGTGWVMDITPNSLKTYEDVHNALYAHPHFPTGDGWKYFTNVKQYLDIYQSSSKFTEI